MSPDAAGVSRGVSADAHDRWLEALFALAGDAILVAGPDGRLLDANPAACRLVGLDHEDLLGAGVETPAALEPPLPLGRALAAAGRLRGECALRREDGVRLVIEYDAVADPGGDLQLAILRDVTERVRLEGSLRSAQTFLAGALDVAEDAIVSVDEGQRILFFNGGAERMFGYAAGEVLGRPLEVLLPEGQGPAHQAHVRRFAADPRPSMMMANRREVSGRRKDGSVFPADASITKLAQKGEWIFTAVVRDATERKRLAEQLVRSQRLEAVGRLAGGVAHDFNNLLTVILGYAETALGRLGPGHAVREELEEIRKAGERAAALTRQLLAFSRKQRLQPVVLDLNALVTDLGRMLQRLIGEDVELLTRLAGDLGRVRADPTQIEQVIVNLVVNARDAMPRGGRLTLETANAQLDAAAISSWAGSGPGPYVRLVVSDTGVGMAPEVLQHVFEPFFTTKEPGRGTGLGLATVYGIVKQSGGYLWIDSTPGQGTTARLYLPRVAEAPALAAVQRGPAASPGGLGETILVVEDDAAIRQLMVSVLGRLGYRVLEAATGQAADRLAAAAAGPLDLLITDLILPGLGGVELASRLRRDRPGIGVLFVSGYAEPRAGGDLAAGARLLQKPFTREQLAQSVREALEDVRPATG